MMSSLPGKPLFHFSFPLFSLIPGCRRPTPSPGRNGGDKDGKIAVLLLLCGKERRRRSTVSVPFFGVSARQTGESVSSPEHGCTGSMGLAFSPTSPGVSVTEPSSRTKQGMPMAPVPLMLSKTALVSRIFRNSFRLLLFSPMSIILNRSEPSIWLSR